MSGCAPGDSGLTLATRVPAGAVCATLGGDDTVAGAHPPPLPCLLLRAGWWALIGVVTRVPEPALRVWTDAAIIAGLAGAYVTVWVVVRHRSGRTRRWTAVRALATALTLTVLLSLLELPAMLGLVSYTLVADPDQRLTDAFVADSDLAFRRPPHFSWTGPVRSDLGGAWNVPLAPAKVISSRICHQCPLRRKRRATRRSLHAVFSLARWAMHRHGANFGVNPSLRIDDHGWRPSAINAFRLCPDLRAIGAGANARFRRRCVQSSPLGSESRTKAK